MLANRESGSAAIEAVFAIVGLLVMSLAFIEVAFALYARNVVIASAHEGSRAGIELGRSSKEAVEIARSTVDRATGRLVGDLDVAAEASRADGVKTVTVRVNATLRGLGLMPFRIPVRARSSSSMDSD